MPSYRMEVGTIQHGFSQSRKKIQIMGGGFGNGKTTAAVIKGLRLAKDYPGSNGLIARATYPKLNDTIRKEFIRWCPPGWVKRRPTKDDNTLYLKNETVVNFRYVAQKGKTSEDGTTTSNLLSATFDWIIVDQVEDPELTYKDFLDLLGRLRGETPYQAEGEDDPTMPLTGPRWIILTMNPTSGWPFKKLVRPYQLWKEKGIRTDELIVDESTGEPLIDLYEGSTYTNAANLAPDFIKGLEATYRGQMRERFLMGKWAAFEGLVYPDYDKDRHLLPYNVIWEHLLDCLRRHVRVKVVEAYDFGITSPSCYILAFVDDFGRTFILDGFYRPNFHYTDHPQAVKDIRARYGGFLKFESPIYADPAIYKRTVVEKKKIGQTIAKLLADLGMKTVPADNSVISGISKVTQYLSGTDFAPHIVTEETPGPLLYICDNLTWFDDEISSYFWKKNPLGVHIDEPVDNNDHAMDTTKYLLSKLPAPSDIIVPSQMLPPKWRFWHEVDDARG